LRGVVDHDTAGFACLRSVDGGHAGTSGEQTDLRFGEVEISKVFNCVLFIVEADGLTYAALACQQVQVTNGEFALLKDTDHGLADSTRGTHDRDIELLPYAAHALYSGSFRPTQGLTYDTPRELPRAPQLGGLPGRLRILRLALRPGTTRANANAIAARTTRWRQRAAWSGR